MSYLFLVNKILLLVLGFSTGLVKVFRMEAEMILFRKAGFPDGLTILFGLAQIVATAMVLYRPAARYGAVTLGVTFAIATGVLFVNRMIPFGFFSLLFIGMAALAYFDNR